MNETSKRAITALLLAAASCLAGGLAAGPQAGAQKPSFPTETEIVTVDVVVTARNGAAVTGLRPEDFEVSEDGALASSGHPAEAVPYFERALAAGPRTPMALNGLGLTRLELGDRAGAASAFRESLRLDPKQPNVAAALRELGWP